MTKNAKSPITFHDVVLGIAAAQKGLSSLRAAEQEANELEEEVLHGISAQLKQLQMQMYGELPYIAFDEVYGVTQTWARVADKKSAKLIFRQGTPYILADERVYPVLDICNMKTLFLALADMLDEITSERVLGTQMEEIQARIASAQEALKALSGKS